MQGLVTVTEAAVILGVSERTVWAWIKAGELEPDPGLRRIRRTMLERDQVEALAEQRSAS